MNELDKASQKVAIAAPGLLIGFFFTLILAELGEGTTGVLATIFDLAPALYLILVVSLIAMYFGVTVKEGEKP